MNGKVPVVAGTGAPSTRETIELTRDAQSMGADAALVVTRYYYRPNNKELIAHYSSVIGAVDIPIILYNIPKFAGYNMEPQVAVKLVEQFDQVVGIKDSSGSIAQLSQLTAAIGKKVSVLAGTGDTILPAPVMGGSGAIVAVAIVAPRLCRDLYQAFKAGDLSEARELQMKALLLSEILTRRFNQISAVKEALNQLGLPGGFLRMPSPELDEQARMDIRSAVSSLLTPNRPHRFQQ